MTIIAWDGTFIVADRLITINGDLKATGDKLFRLENGEVLGIWMNVDVAWMLVDWYKGGCKKEDWPSYQEKNDEYACLLVATAGGVKYVEKWPKFYQVQDKFMAWGGGARYAMGAMDQGAGAIEAVRCACRLCSGCGCGIDWFNLKTGESGRETF